MAGPSELPTNISTVDLEPFDRLVDLIGLESFATRELLLLGHYINPDSPGFRRGVRSAMLAGYGGTRESLTSQASRTIRKARACGLASIILEQHGAGLVDAAQSLGRCLVAQRTRGVPTPDGQIVSVDLGPDYAVQLQAAKFVVALHKDAKGANDPCGAGGDLDTEPGPDDDGLLAEDAAVPNCDDLAGAEQLIPAERQATEKFKNMSASSRILQGEAIDAGLAVVDAVRTLHELEVQHSDKNSAPAEETRRD